MIKDTLKLVAAAIDGELFEYDDGFVIEVKNPTLWLKAHADGSKAWGGNQGAADLDAVAGVKFVFDADGTLNTVQYV